MAVYFMQMGEAGPIKIGHALDPFKRRSTLQIGSVAQIEILAIVDGSRGEEQAIHKLFSHLHIRGEMFSPASDLLEYIEAMPKHERPVPKPRGRPQINEEQTPARFPGGTLDRIDRVLDPDTNEKRSDFIREAVEKELLRREKKR
jgi:hypothetical protein